MKRSAKMYVLGGCILAAMLVEHTVRVNACALPPNVECLNVGARLGKERKQAKEVEELTAKWLRAEDIADGAMAALKYAVEHGAEIKNYEGHCLVLIENTFYWSPCMASDKISR